MENNLRSIEGGKKGIDMEQLEETVNNIESEVNNNYDMLNRLDDRIREIDVNVNTEDLEDQIKDLKKVVGREIEQLAQFIADFVRDQQHQSDPEYQKYLALKSKFKDE